VRLFTTIAALRCYLAQCRSIEGTVGFVPTMGALHAGHESLMRRAKQENQWVVASIFVNPLQFGPAEDLTQYPRSLEADRDRCEAVGVDILFVPTPEELGIPAQGSAGVEVNKTLVVVPDALKSNLCGPARPGHFDGVATIVSKLFNLIQPDAAYFGQKDAQQLAIIQHFAKDLNFPIEIVGCPIVRESSGLALSSRNAYLTADQMTIAPILSQSLHQSEQLFKQGQYQSDELIRIAKTHLASNPGIQLEYIELVDPATLQTLTSIAENGLLAIAAKIGKTRLIDNVLLRTRKPIMAIDGPAGAGKSTVTKQVANTLGLFYLDTGAMYRAITWLVMNSGIAITDEPAIAELVGTCEIELTPEKVEINHQDITLAIRTPEVTANVSAIAAQAAVRKALVRQQREYGRRGGVVLEGRDIGTHVFPDAEVKVFLTATVEERARRRQKDLERLGQSVPSLDSLIESIAERDAKDSNRAIAPLKQALDALEVVTDGMRIEEVVDRLVKLYQAQ
jgi:pantoate ligase / CMP/dCMP kinase